MATHDPIPARLDALKAATAPELKAQRRDLFGSEPPGLGRVWLERKIGCRLQEIAYCGRKPANVKRLEEIGEALTETTIPETETPIAPETVTPRRNASGKPKAAAKPKPTQARTPTPALTPRKATARPETKRERLIKLLSRKGGAALAAISETLGWLPNTTRAALTGLRKAGFAIEAEKPAGGGASRYRITARPAEPAR